MSPHNLIKSAMTNLKKPRLPHLPARSQQSTPHQAAGGPGAPRHPSPRRRARRPAPGGASQVSANFDRDDGRSTGAHLQR